MIDEFIARHLAQVDDLAELKVTLVALRLLEHKQSPTAHVTLAELAAHPALREGLGSFPRLTLEAALRKGIARGVWLTTSEDLSAARLLCDNAPARELIAALGGPEQAGSDAIASRETLAAAVDALAREAARLEGAEAYAPTPADEAEVAEWLARGYTLDELRAAVRRALAVPRRASAPHRRLKDCAAQVTSAPPAQPAPYHAQLVAKSERLDEVAVYYRELAGRAPRGREFGLLRAAVGLYGLGATQAVLKRIVTREQSGVDSLLGLLADGQDAELDQARRAAQPDVVLRDMLRLYESTVGAPATAAVADEIRHLLEETPDVEIWQAAFARAASPAIDKKWAYARKVLTNPSPDLLLPPPVNATAQAAYDLYRKRMRQIPPLSVAREMNVVAAEVTDLERWTQAFDAAEAANALKWSYIKAVLTRPAGAREAAPETSDAKRRPARPTAKRGGPARREQVHYTDADRADESGADAILAALDERKRRRAAGGS